MSGPADRTAFDGQHERLASLLGAYADEELAADVRRSVETHLSQCDRCAQELRVQLALKRRLQAEEGSAEPSAVLARLQARVAGLGDDVGNPGRRAGSERPVRQRVFAHPIVAWSGWLIAASLAALWFMGSRRTATQGMGMSMGPLTPVAVDSVPEPIADAALHDFRRVALAALPRGPELATLRAEVPFSVPALRAPHMRLIGTWTTTIDGVPTAVLAYRCHDRLVVQYVVPEHVFFRPPRVRQAIATSGLYAAGEGKIHAVGWPGTDNGSFLVGEFTAAELAAMRL
ncbi:MAG: anti-sigma factor family protein [Gemmatimonadales bacterium]